MTVLILEVDFQTRADLRAAGNFRDDLKAFYLARSAVTAGQALLKDDFLHSNQYDALDELWAYPFPEYPLGDGTLTAAIVDESGKINLNLLVDPQNGKKVDARVEQLRRLFDLLQLDRKWVDPLVDWLDKDTDPLPFGAENETYQRLDPPYSSQDGPFDTLEELHMVKGITDEVYRKIAPYVTVYGGPNDKININTADTSVLQSLDEGIDETTARRIIENRPFGNENVATKFRNSVSEAIYNHMVDKDVRSIDWVGYQSKLFSITAEGKVNGIRKIIHAVVRRGNKMELLYFKVE